MYPDLEGLHFYIGSIDLPEDEGKGGGGVGDQDFRTFKIN